MFQIQFKLLLVILYSNTVFVFILRNPKQIFKCNHAVGSLPRHKSYDAQQIELLRILGRVDIITDGEAPGYHSETTIRIFEARLTDGTKCFLKEYSPTGIKYGKKELSITRRLANKWSEISESSSLSMNSTSTVMTSTEPYFPILLGSLQTDIRVESSEFKTKWRMRFPSAAPPESGNLWLVFQWNECTFRSLRRYPELPQLVEGLDYFSKDRRTKKRWKFIRKIMKSCLVSTHLLHRAGYCHNTLSSDCIWLSTTNQQDVAKLRVVLSELGSCEKLSNLGPYAKNALAKDLYDLGLTFLELVISSFSEGNIGAEKARATLDGREYRLNLLIRAEDRDFSQLHKGEYKRLFESVCKGDFQRLRNYVGSVTEWGDAYSMLEADEGAVWRLIFFLLASERLCDDDNGNPIRVTAKSILHRFKSIFEDI